MPPPEARPPDGVGERSGSRCMLVDVFSLLLASVASGGALGIAGDPQAARRMPLWAGNDWPWRTSRGDVI